MSGTVIVNTNAPQEASPSVPNQKSKPETPATDPEKESSRIDTKRHPSPRRLTSLDLAKQVQEYHERNPRHDDPSLEDKSPEELVRYMMESRGFGEAAARSLVATYPQRLLSTLYKELPEGIPSIGQRQALADEEWD